MTLFFLRDARKSYRPYETSSDFFATCRSHNWIGKCFFPYIYDRLPWTSNSTETSEECCSYRWCNSKTETITQHFPVALFSGAMQKYLTLSTLVRKHIAALSLELQQDQHKELGPRNKDVLTAMKTFQKKLLSPPILTFHYPGARFT